MSTDPLVQRALELLAHQPKVTPKVHKTSSSTAAPIVFDPASPTARPIYWERAGSIVGPGIPEFLAKVGAGPSASFWVVAQFEGGPVWINSIMLRSKREFENHVPLKPVELVRESKGTKR